MKFWQLSGGAGTEPAQLRIYGDIGSWWDGNTAAEFAAALDAVQAAELHVFINSYGGLADQGVAMYNALRRFAERGTLYTYNDGIVASAAVAPFLAGDHRIANPGSVLMIHDAATGVWGPASEMRKAAEALEKVSDSVAELYTQRTSKDLEDMKAMMAATTYMSPAEQLEHGFATAQASEAAAVQASLQGNVLMCGGQQFDMQKLPGMPAAALAFMLSASKPKQPVAPVQKAPAATNNEAEKVVQQAGAAGSQKGEGPKMDLNTLKADHKDVHAAAMAEGAAAERMRIAAIQQHAPAGFEQAAQKAIDEGSTPEVFAMSVMQQIKQQGTQFLQQRQADADAEGGANGAPNAQGAAPEAKQQADEAAFMAAAKAAAAAKAGK